MTETTIATAPAVEATPKQLPTNTQLSSSRSRGAGLSIVAAGLRLIFAIAKFAWSIITAPWALIVAIHGLEMEIGRTHRPRPCALLCGDVHDVGEICRLQKVADCDVCGQTVDIDYFGNCLPAGDRWRLHRVTNRRPKPILRLTRVHSTEEVIVGMKK